jgi:type I restriction enzyme M protein
VPGVCKIATLDEIEAQGWSLNPGRYVGVTDVADEGWNFGEQLEELAEEIDVLNTEAAGLHEQIVGNITLLLENIRRA